MDSDGLYGIAHRARALATRVDPGLRLGGASNSQQIGAPRGDCPLALRLVDARHTPYDGGQPMQVADGQADQLVECRIHIAYEQ